MPAQDFTGVYSLGSGSVGGGQWNSQNSSWQNSGNVPVKQINIGNDDPPPPKAPVSFWDAPFAGLDPSNVNISDWDKCTIAGRLLPGVSAVTSTRGKRFDVKKAKGSHFATITFVGYDPSRVTIVNRIWTQPQLDKLASVMNLLHQPPSKFKDGSFTAFDILHPALQLLGIGSVLIESVDGLQPSSAKGVWETKIHALEYRKSNAPATSTATGTSNIQDVPHVLTGAPGPNGITTPGNDALFGGPFGF